MSLYFRTVISLAVLITQSAAIENSDCRQTDYKSEKLVSTGQSALKLAELDVLSSKECQEECCAFEMCNMVQVEEYSDTQILCSLFQCSDASKCSKELIPGFDGTSVAFLTKNNAGKRQSSNETLIVDDWFDEDSDVTEVTNETSTNAQTTVLDAGKSTTSSSTDSTSTDSVYDNEITTRSQSMNETDMTDLISDMSSSVPYQPSTETSSTDSHSTSSSSSSSSDSSSTNTNRAGRSTDNSYSKSSTNQETQSMTSDNENSESKEGTDSESTTSKSSAESQYDNQMFYFDTAEPGDVTDRVLLFACGVGLFMAGVVVIVAAVRCQTHRHQYQPLA